MSDIPTLGPLFIPGHGPVDLPPQTRRAILRRLLANEDGAFISDYLSDAINDHILGTTPLTSPTNPPFNVW